MAVRPAVGHQLVGAAGGEHLATLAAGVFVQEAAGAAGQAEAAVAGVHDE